MRSIRNSLIFNTIFIVFAFVILCVNLYFRKFLIELSNRCKSMTDNGEPHNSIKLANNSSLMFLIISAFNSLIGSIGVLGTLRANSTILYIYGIFLYSLFAVELICVAIVFGSFKNFTEHQISCDKPKDGELINIEFFICTLFLGAITICVSLIQILAISNACTLAEELRIAGYEPNQSLGSFLSLSISKRIQNKQSIENKLDTKIYYF